MNERHEQYFLSAQERDQAAMTHLLQWLDDDVWTIARGMGRRLGVSPAITYEEVRQEFVLAILDHRVPYNHH